MIVRGDQILAVRRPEDDDELPGIWGLPAATLRGETVEDVIARIGRDKLGVKLTPVRLLAFGAQDRQRWNSGKCRWRGRLRILNGNGRRWSRFVPEWHPVRCAVNWP